MGRGAGLKDAIEEPLLEAVAEIEVEVDAGLEIVARTVPWATYANYCSRLIADAGELVIIVVCSLSSPLLPVYLILGLGWALFRRAETDPFAFASRLY